ncbi:MAG: protein translocase subunit SecF [Proteobacteria bacterium]|nr:protein translocase subunit SecF [Pseudomonadota bacterium]
MPQWIKPGTTFEFYGTRRRAYAISWGLTVASLAMLGVNVLVRGSALNYGTDFTGGSQLQVQFTRAVSPSRVRSALEQGGFAGSEVVAMAGGAGPNTFMLRMGEVSVCSDAERTKAKAELQRAFGRPIAKLEHKEGSDKLYVVLSSASDVTKKDAEDAAVGKIERAFAAAGVDVQQVRLFGRARDRAFEVSLGGLGTAVERALNKALGPGSVGDIPQVETVGGRMGRQLRDSGIKALIYSMLLILLYITLRFDLRYAPGALVALVHDVVITVGVFALLWHEFSLSVVAALMTIAGYSVNDTIVVFDRIREDAARLRDRKFDRVVNAAINETLSRTLLTSLTLVTCLALWLLGTGAIREFGFALSIGIVLGTYSSIFVASPMVVFLNERFGTIGRQAAAR